MREMTTIKLGKETSAYISKYFNEEIEIITIKDGERDLEWEITNFIKELIKKNQTSFVSKSYVYDRKNKLLEFWGKGGIA